MRWAGWVSQDWGGSGRGGLLRALLVGRELAGPEGPPVGKIFWFIYFLGNSFLGSIFEAEFITKPLRKGRWIVHRTIHLNKEVNWGKVKMVKKTNLFRNGRNCSFWTRVLQWATGKSDEGLGWALEGRAWLGSVKIRKTRDRLWKFSKWTKPLQSYKRRSVQLIWWDQPALSCFWEPCLWEPEIKLPKVDIRQPLTSSLSLKKIPALSAFCKSGIYFMEEYRS